MNIPVYWKSSLNDIEEVLGNIKKGEVSVLCKSAGGRNVYRVVYGKKNDLKRTANLTSAQGAGDLSCFADKSSDDYRPTLFLVGSIHSSEFEGTVAMLNLINLIETGVDFAGNENEFLSNVTKRANIVIIPCANPDGRARLPFDSTVGMTFEDFRYYGQGAWADGSLCDYPKCKTIHPMRLDCKFLGTYFNDDGINLMHDDFFTGPCAETLAIMKTAEEYVPDMTILSHGGTNCVPCISIPSYAPGTVKEEISKFNEFFKSCMDDVKIPCNIPNKDKGENRNPPGMFNLTSALVQIIGEPCFTFESNQGLDQSDELVLTYDEIYKTHIILFEEALKFILGDDAVEK